MDVWPKLKPEAEKQLKESGGYLTQDGVLFGPPIASFKGMGLKGVPTMLALAEEMPARPHDGVNKLLNGLNNFSTADDKKSIADQYLSYDLQPVLTQGEGNHIVDKHFPKSHELTLQELCEKMKALRETDLILIKNLLNVKALFSFQISGPVTESVWRKEWNVAEILKQWGNYLNR